ncbi:dihydrofolate reductase [Candidatus Halobonum tyrrellensis]|uniref:dihydrofolate reductase n=1 Tax=Candidatus Halobonum tyrrellensis G22 TaxID=1324957 RepID=V4HDU1_9EURY|nr:dihydrofolate reductase [Candidatus Halobonum tyrrellensis]ESP88238.1 dihydrofolate reductase [Candidatus Halobonum tyrrellensis G22]
MSAETDVDLVLIVAVADDGVIGADGEIPWHYPADLAHFEETTTGHPVIAGRRTYDSIVADLGGPLPGRTNVVLSRDDPDLPEGVVHAGSVDEAVEAAAATGAEVAYVAGGAAVYAEFLDRDLVDRMLVTEIPETVGGDTRFPDWDRDDWRETARESRDGLEFVTYERADAEG